jgi:allantoin racemase
MKPIRIWYQSYVDYDNGKIYWDRLRKHLDDVVEPGTIVDIKGIAALSGSTASQKYRLFNG